MSESKHTPGPWNYTLTGQVQLIGPKNEDGTQNCIGIARVYENGFQSFRANLRLIAAAPDLLEACKQAENEMENAIIGLNVNPIAYAQAIIQRLEMAINATTAAIAKAEGRNDD